MLALTLQVSIIIQFEYGYFEIVKLLLADARVDPTARDNCAVRMASHIGNYDIMKLLLADAHVDSSAENNYAVRMD
jgi:hypothetical protein